MYDINTVSKDEYILLANNSYNNLIKGHGERNERAMSYFSVDENNENKGYFAYELMFGGLLKVREISVIDESTEVVKNAIEYLYNLSDKMNVVCEINPKYEYSTLFGTNAKMDITIRHHSLVSADNLLSNLERYMPYIDEKILLDMLGGRQDLTDEIFMTIINKYESQMVRLHHLLGIGEISPMDIPIYARGSTEYKRYINWYLRNMKDKLEAKKLFDIVLSDMKCNPYMSEKQISIFDNDCFLFTKIVQS